MEEFLDIIADATLNDEVSTDEEFIANLLDNGVPEELARRAAEFRPMVWVDPCLDRADVGEWLSK